MTETASTRRIRTKQSGEVEVEVGAEQIVVLADGLMGFPDFHEFAILPHSEESPFLWLQSMDEPDLAFVTMDPQVFSPGYSPDIPSADLAPIGLNTIDQALILSIIVIPEDPKKMTANLQGPVVINPENRQGMQVISRSPQHKVRHYILGDPGSET